MFGFSGTELILIMLVALLVINPKDLPATLRSVRDTARKIKQTAQEFTGAIMGDENIVDLKKEAAKINQEIQQIVDLNGDLQPTYSLDDISDTLAEKHRKTLPSGQKPSSPKS